jgi:MFS family permease
MFGKNVGIFSVVGAAFHQFTLFSLFAFSNICKKLEKDDKKNRDKLHGANETLIFFLSPICSIYMCIFCFFGGAVVRRIGTHFTIIAGCISICLSSYLLRITNSIYVDFIVIIFYGIGFGISMTSAVSNACKYFPKNRGLITSICGGFGGNLGSALCNFINARWDALDYLTFHIIFMIVGTILAVGFITNFQESAMDNPITNDSDSKKEPLTKSLEVDETNQKNYNSKTNKNEDDIPTADQIAIIGEQQAELEIILKHWRIYFILLIFFCTCFVQGFIMTVGFTYGSEFISKNVDEGRKSMGLVFTIMSLTGCIAGPVWGFIHDKLEFQKTLMLVNILSMCNSALIGVTKNHIVSFGFSVIFNGSLNSGAFSMIFPHVSKVFGFKYAGEMYGIVVLSTGISSLIASILLRVVFQKIEQCLNVFFIGSFLNLIGFGLCFFENDEKFLSL